MKFQLHFDSLPAFLQMDGHGTYIWAAYGITLIVLAANLLWPRLTRRRLINELRPEASSSEQMS